MIGPISLVAHIYYLQKFFSYGRFKQTPANSNCYLIQAYIWYYYYHDSRIFI